MVCNYCQAVDRHFDGRVARRELRSYRRRGPGSTTRALLEILRETESVSVSLLDIGSGVGAVAHEALSSLAAEATLVEASSAYLTEAKAEAARRGHAERLRSLHGDFVEIADRIAAADVVTLDRVVCCYPDAGRLVRASAEKARKWYGLSYPRDRWYVRVVVSIQNAFRRLRGSAFRVYVHPERAIRAVLQEMGFREWASRGGVVWRVAFWERTVTDRS